MAIAASPASTALPSYDLSSVLSSLQQALAQLTATLTSFQAQLGTGPAAGAALLGGGPTQGTPAGSGCGCGGGSGAASGASQVGQAPAGAAGAPSRAKGAPAKGGGANAGPEAQQASRSDSAAAPAGSKGQRLVDEVRKHLGTKYVFGGESPSGFDCSGLLLYVADKLGIKLPRTAAEQAKAGSPVDKGSLQPGDLVFFKTDGSGKVSHAGMYIGDGKMIHAPKTGDVVKVASINDSYYSSRWAGARRIT